ncbi:hypothetical protein ACFWXA_35645 [Streptomyces atroolivaceus]
MISTVLAVLFDRNRTAVDQSPLGGSGSLTSHRAGVVVGEGGRHCAGL